jgi:hemerythrin superfamily protein
MDAIELLKHDHRMVEQLFRDFRAADSDELRRAVAEVLVRELSKHAAVEETLFYPFAVRVLDGSATVDRQLAQHMVLKQLLVALDRVQAGDAQQHELLRQIEAAVAEHVRTEEGELMPRLGTAADDEALRELGREIDDSKRRAPTRGHPHAPDRPPALTLAAPVAAIYDRLRDRLQGRPRT